jgi:hypothetical protein
MHGVERPGVGRREVGHPGRDDAQAAGLEAPVDLADQVLLDAIGLDDGKRAFDRHGVPFDLNPKIGRKPLQNRVLRPKPPLRLNGARNGLS